jgi:CUB/sushi domain-containing protein
MSLYCNKGFNLTGKKDWVCLEPGRWSVQEPVCQIVLCILPDKEQNGIQLHATFSNGSSITTNSVSYGTEIQVFCDIGFKTSSDIKRICQEDGSWNGTTPVCNVVTCDHPGNNSVINGTYIDISDKFYLSGRKNYSQTIKVVCHTGYTVTSGSEIRSCQDNGTWSDIDPVCTIVKCFPLEKVDGVSYGYSFSNESNIYRLNATVNISCDNGMIPDGSKVRRCIENSTWDGISSTCSKLSAFFIAWHFYFNK